MVRRGAKKFECREFECKKETDKPKCHKLEAKGFECIDENQHNCEKFELKDFRCIGEDHDVRPREARKKCTRFEGTQLVCLDGTQSTTQPPPTIFRQCIPNTKRCNGEKDCKEGSDERNCPHVNATTVSTTIKELKSSVLPTTIMPESHFNFSLRLRKKRKRIISAGISKEGNIRAIFLSTILLSVFWFH